MSDYDLVIRGGTVVTAFDSFRADVAIRGETIAAVGEGLQGRETIDADGLLVMPGGVDSHCHVGQLQPGGKTDEEGFVTGSTSALLGGTTTAITFSTQFKGGPIGDLLDTYHRHAAAEAMFDYSFHQIIADATDETIFQEVPRIVASGVRSLKVFLTYDALHLDDAGYLRVLAAARRTGALVTVHCENFDAINWRSDALVADGRISPKYHAWSRPVVVEREATYRAIALAELVDTPIQIFHVSSPEVVEEIARAQARGVKVWAETCPQYFRLTADDMDRPGPEGAKYMCSPAPRDEAAIVGMWDAVRRGTIGIVSSDHSGYSYGGPRGKWRNSIDGTFVTIPNGVPGIGTRMPILFSEGVVKGRMTANDFVRLTASEPARLFGLAGRKGSITPGCDADILLWDPARRTVLTNGMLRQAIDYTPYEGMLVTGWPVTTLLRGRVVVRDGTLLAEPGSGRFLARKPYDYIRPSGRLANGFDAAAVRG